VNRTGNSNLPGNFQNGGYWALPVSWALQTVAKRNPALATKLLADCLADFRKNGIWEFVNWATPVPGDRVGHPNYVASATAVHSFVRDFASLKGDDTSAATSLLLDRHEGFIGTGWTDRPPASPVEGDTSEVEEVLLQPFGATELQLAELLTTMSTKSDETDLTIQLSERVDDGDAPKGSTSPFRWTMAPAPAPFARQAYYNASMTTFGGGIVHWPEGPGGGSFHLFATGMTRGCGIHAWSSNAKVIHAVSDQPEGPYMYADDTLPVLAAALICEIV
jgi:hypothetical protein